MSYPRGYISTARRTDPGLEQTSWPNDPQDETPEMYLNHCDTCDETKEEDFEDKCEKCQREEDRIEWEEDRDHPDTEFADMLDDWRGFWNWEAREWQPWKFNKMQMAC